MQLADNINHDSPECLNNWTHPKYVKEDPFGSVTVPACGRDVRVKPVYNDGCKIGSVEDLKLYLSVPEGDQLLEWSSPHICPVLIMNLCQVATYF